MSLQHIRTSIDPSLFLKGDVVIVKRTYVFPGRKLKTICTKCTSEFPTSYRRMGRLGTKRGLEVRNVPQCPSCRSRRKSL